MLRCRSRFARETSKQSTGAVPNLAECRASPTRKAIPGFYPWGGRPTCFPEGRQGSRISVVTAAEANVALPHRWLRSRLGQFRRRSSASAVTFLVNKPNRSHFQPSPGRTSFAIACARQPYRRRSAYQTQTTPSLGFGSFRRNSLPGSLCRFASPPPFRSQGFSPSQRFSPLVGLRSCFIPHPPLGFRGLQSFAPAAQQPHLVDATWLS